MLLSLVSEEVWTRMAGAGIIVVAIVCARRRHIDVGLEGDPPSFAITGCAAVVVAAITAAFGVFVIIWPEVFSSR